LRQQGVGTLRDGQRVCEKPLLDHQSFGKASGWTMRAPAIPDEALVEMNVPIDESGQDQQAAQIDDHGIITKCLLRNEPAGLDSQVPDLAVLAQRVAKQ